MFAVLIIVLGGVVVSTPAGAVIDSAVVVPTPTPGTTDNSLSSVSCVSVSFCVATGFYRAGPVNQTLVEQWNGASWTVIPSPNSGTNSNGLASVSCVSESFCVATGSYNDGLLDLTLVEQWDGANWSVIPSPNSGTNSNVLNSVSCVNTAFCVATGYYYNGSANQPLDQTLALSLTGPEPAPTTTTRALPDQVAPAFTG